MTLYTDLGALDPVPILIHVWNLLRTTLYELLSSVTTYRRETEARGAETPSSRAHSEQREGWQDPGSHAFSHGLCSCCCAATLLPSTRGHDLPNCHSFLLQREAPGFPRWIYTVTPGRAKPL